jgi:hypothetical protein
MAGRMKQGLVLELTLKSGRLCYVQSLRKTNQGHDILRVLPGRVYEPLAASELQRLVAGPSEYVSKTYGDRMVRDGDQERGVFPIPEADMATKWFRMFVSGLPESPEGWSFESEHGQRISGHEFSKRFPAMVESPSRARWLMDVDWHPRYIRKLRDNWFPDDDDGHVVKGN